MTTKAGYIRGALAILCAGFIAHALWLACVAEDAYITYRFARNVVEGHGFVWNVGAAPVEGFTNFLWLQLCIAALASGLDVARVTQVAGIAAGVGTLLVSWRLARRSLGVSHIGALFTVGMLTAAGPLAAWSSSGMETVFFTWCVTSAVYVATCFLSTGRRRDGLLLVLALLTATLTRPEGLGIAAILLAAVYGLSPDRTARWRTVAIAGAYAMGFAVYFVWRYATFGYPLPNTFYAKTGGGWDQYWRGFKYVAYFAIHYVTPWTPWVALFAWRASGERRAGGFEWTRQSLESRETAGLLVTVAVTAGYLGYVVLVGGDYMAMYRFVVPVVPLIFALLGYGADRAVRGARITTARRVVLGAMAGATACGLLVQSTPYEEALFAPVPQMHGTYRGIGVERWHVNRFHRIAQFFSEQQPDHCGSILTYDIGVVGYLTRFAIYDALGIVDPVIAHAAPDGSMGLGLAGHEKQDLRYSYSLRPTFVMYTVQLRPAPADWPQYPADLEAQVRADYELKSVWLTDPANHEAGYFTYLERKGPSCAAATGHTTDADAPSR